MRPCRRFAVLFLFSTVFAIAQQSTPQQTPPAQTPPAQTPPAELPDMPTSQVPPTIEPTGPTVVLDTSMGRITCKLFEKEAPLTVANFVQLAQGTKPWTDPVSKKKMKNIGRVEVPQEAFGDLACGIFQPRRRSAELIKPRERGVEVGFIE